MATDLTDFGELSAIVTDAEALNGGVEILINNAGINIPGALAHQNVADLQTVVNTNLLAPLMLTRAVLPRMPASGRGAVVNVSSGCRVPEPGCGG